MYVGLILLFNALIPSSGLAESEGITLFKQENYRQAIRIFVEELKKQSDNPVINFYMGRSLLAQNQADKAIGYIEKTVQLTPKNPDYHFWLGVAYWANMEFEKERQSYLKALKLDPGHLQANLYLGHNYMDRNQWNEALNQYDRVLAIDSAVPDALYNRALVLRKMGKSADEKTAWKIYLDHYRLGKLAIHATELLNDYGDFSYRIYLLGTRRIVVSAINFEPAGSALKAYSLHELKRIGDVLKKNSTLSLHVVTYVKDKQTLAKSRAKAIKKSILETFSGIEPSRLTASWFGVPEKISSGNKTYVLNESVNFITRK